MSKFILVAINQILPMANGLGLTDHLGHTQPGPILGSLTIVTMVMKIVLVCLLKMTGGARQGIGMIMGVLWNYVIYVQSLQICLTNKIIVYFLNYLLQKYLF
jgi:hypothetical protein